MTKHDLQLQPMQLSDYAGASALWQRSEGVKLRDADSIDSIGRYLERNPGLSFVAKVNHQLVGTVLCGHDGRRGYLYHLAVEHAYRRSGIATALFDAASHALRTQGINKIHIMVLADNFEAAKFWRVRDFSARDDVILMSYTTPSLADA